MFDLLDQSAVSYQVILTKHDELKIAERDEVLAATMKALEKRPAAFPEVIFTSAHGGEGIPELRAAIVRLCLQGKENAPGQEEQRDVCAEQNCKRHVERGPAEERESKLRCGEARDSRDHRLSRTDGSNAREHHRSERGDEESDGVQGRDEGRGEAQLPCEVNDPEGRRNRGSKGEEAQQSDELPIATAAQGPDSSSRAQAVHRGGMSGTDKRRCGRPCRSLTQRL